MIDGVVSRIVQRLEEAEARTTGVVRGLEASVAEFDQRLRATESRIEAPESRLEQLAADLTRNMEASRAELAQKLEGAVDERLTAMERSLKTTAAQVQASEQRSTQAMERFGREVLRVAEGLGQRMEGVEARSAETIGKVGGEVTRIAEVMEHRLRHADHVQAESLERLGAEIARITERLAERIANAERRSAQAIDDVGEQVSRITERFNQRHERSASDLAERIRPERGAHRAPSRGGPRQARPAPRRLRAAAVRTGRQARAGFRPGDGRAGVALRRAGPAPGAVRPRHLRLQLCAARRRPGRLCAAGGVPAAGGPNARRSTPTTSIPPRCCTTSTTRRRASSSPSRPRTISIRTPGRRRSLAAPRPPPAS
ncbi:MAG: hypothetical protein WDM92_03515 [Caulobacteraceae bacterium]